MVPQYYRFNPGYAQVHMTAMPSGIESWRKPVVFDKTSTANLGSVCATAPGLFHASRIANVASNQVTLQYRILPARRFAVTTNHGASSPLTHRWREPDSN